MNIGNKLKAKREEKQMTQQQVAEIIFRDKTTISKIENGNGSYQIKTIQAIADAIDCEVRIDILDKNIGTDLLNRPTLINEQDFNLEIKEKAGYVYEEIQKSLENLFSKKEFSIWDLFSNFYKSRYKRIILAEIQNKVINELLKNDPDNFTENDAIVIKINSDYENLFLDAATSLSYDEILLDDYGFEKGWSTSVITDGCILRGDYAYISLSDIFIKHSDKKIILKSIQKNNNDKIQKAENYLEKNPNGFPFICYLPDRENNLNNNTIQVEYDNDEINTIYGKIVYAWKEEDAVEQYLKSINNSVISNYFYNYLKEDIIERLYYDEMDYQLFENGKDVKDGFEEITHLIDTESEKEYKSQASELLTLDMLFQLLGKENIMKIFIDENKYDVICFMSDRDREMYNFIM